MQDWGCNLYAARVSRLAEDAALQMPLPPCVHSQLHLFATLSAVALWLKCRCIQVWLCGCGCCWG